MVNRKTSYLLLLLMIAGCTSRSPYQKLSEYINNPKNQITQSVHLNESTMVAKWLPYEYRNKISKNIDKEEDSNYCYFDVRFEAPNTKSIKKEDLLYINFNIQQDFTLLCGRDSIPAVICQKIEGGVAGNYQYILAFEKSSEDSEQNDFSLIYHDRVFGVGTVAFKYKQNDLRKIPQL